MSIGTFRWPETSNFMKYLEEMIMLCGLKEIRFCGGQDICLYKFDGCPIRVYPLEQRIPCLSMTVPSKEED